MKKVYELCFISCASHKNVTYFFTEKRREHKKPLHLLWGQTYFIGQFFVLDVSNFKQKTTTVYFH